MKVVSVLNYVITWTAMNSLTFFSFCLIYSFIYSSLVAQSGQDHGESATCHSTGKFTQGFIHTHYQLVHNLIPLPQVLTAKEPALCQENWLYGSGIIMTNETK